MADLTIHDLDAEVLDRLRQDAEAKGTSLEEAARFVLANWHGLLKWHDDMVERRRQAIEAVEQHTSRTDQHLAALAAAREKFEAVFKKRRRKPGEERADQ
jgi:plasmid stability protein